MSSIFTKNFGVNNAKNFERYVSGGFGTYYLAIGRNLPWDNGDTTPTPTDTANSFYQFWDNMIGMKKITASDMNLVIPRVDWTSGTVYSEYNPDTQLFAQANTASVPYDTSFYVRNTRDQVFKCLFNNGGITSTYSPEINISGMLPENPYVETADGYKWKYMYTIPPGLKEKFFTTQYMPIISEPIVTTNAVDGRLDIIKIITPGSGYNANTNSNSYSIVSVTGNGTGANLTVRVTASSANGANITGVNVINGGSGYTRAGITLSDPIKIAGTQTANLRAIIGPPGGHGSSIEKELGASNLMVSIGIEGDEGGVLPISTIETVGFRQIAVLKDPLLSDGSAAAASAYRSTTKYFLNPPSRNFVHNEYVYSGTSLATATFSGTVEHYDNATYYLYLNNVSGTLTTPATLIGATSGAIATATAVSNPDVKTYSGDLLYIDNTAQIVRNSAQTEQLKLTLRF